MGYVSPLPCLKILFLKCKTSGYSESSVGKSNGCSSRGSGFESQHPPNSSQCCTTTVPGNPQPLYECGAQIDTQPKYLYINQSIKRTKKQTKTGQKKYCKTSPGFFLSDKSRLTRNLFLVQSFGCRCQIFVSRFVTETQEAKTLAKAQDKSRSHVCRAKNLDTISLFFVSSFRVICEISLTLCSLGRHQTLHYC